MVVYVREKPVSPGRSTALKAYSACSIRGLFRPTECMPCSGRLRTWRGAAQNVIPPATIIHLKIDPGCRLVFL